jgi:Family of unknown function (DUF5946)
MRCIGCQAEFAEIDGPTHEYMLSSPGCWAAYGEVLAREYSDNRLALIHRLTVDTYAVQHPGVNVPAARRSVGVHLSRLYLLLEAEWSTERANNAMLAITEFKDRCDWLEPPSMSGTLSVLEVLQAGSNEEHERRVRAWAESVWKAWGTHHDIVRKWCTGL